MQDGQCQHVWVYDHKDYEHMYQRCKRCGRLKKTDVLNKMIHPYRANQVAKELNIRHDNVDGDV